MIKVHTPIWNCLWIVKDFGIIKFIQVKTLNMFREHPRCGSNILATRHCTSIKLFNRFQQEFFNDVQLCEASSRAEFWKKSLIQWNVYLNLIGRMSLCSVVPQDCSNSENIFVNLNNISTFLSVVVSQTIPRPENWVANFTKRRRI